MSGPKKTKAVEAPKEVPEDAKIIYSADTPKVIVLLF
jgi:hypothetical protein